MLKPMNGGLADLSRAVLGVRVYGVRPLVLPRFWRLLAVSLICNHGIMASILGESGLSSCDPIWWGSDFQTRQPVMMLQPLEMREEIQSYIYKGKELKWTSRRICWKYDEDTRRWGSDFLASFEEETVSAFRINPLKRSASFLSWCHSSNPLATQEGYRESPERRNENVITDTRSSR